MQGTCLSVPARCHSLVLWVILPTTEMVRVCSTVFEVKHVIGSDQLNLCSPPSLLHSAKSRTVGSVPLGFPAHGFHPMKSVEEQVCLLISFRQHRSFCRSPSVSLNSKCALRLICLHCTTLCINGTRALWRRGRSRRRCSRSAFPSSSLRALLFYCVYMCGYACCKYS
jgi:hypothetical protein